MALRHFKSYLEDHKPSRIHFNLDYDIDYYGDYCNMEVAIEYYYMDSYDDDGSEWRDISYDISKARTAIYDAVSYANRQGGESIRLNSIKEVNTCDPD